MIELSLGDIHARTRRPGPRPGRPPHRRYRQRGGNRSRTVADFLIGAHAMMQCDALVTRDAGFYRDYFKGLKVIVPQA